MLVEVNKGQYSQSDVAQTNPIIMELQTPTKTDNVNKRALSGVVDMDVDGKYLSKKMKVYKGRYVIELEIEDQWINQGGVAIVEEEHSISNSGEKSITEGKNVIESPSTFQSQRHMFSKAQWASYQSK